MFTKIKKISRIPTESELKKIPHTFFIIDEKQKKFPFQDLLEKKLKRIGKKIKDLKKNSVVTEHEGGGIICWVMALETNNLFQCHTLLRKSMTTLIKEKPNSYTSQESNIRNYNYHRCRTYWNCIYSR